jgi:hypothetical protein
VHVEVALATAGQAAQLPPHELTLVFDAHNPEQSWVPMGQEPMQEAALSMQTFAHSFCPMGHVAPQLVPSQVAVPPCGARHAEQEEPHDAGEVSRAQPPLHAWNPVPHEKPQRWLSLQVAVPFVIIGQSAGVQQPDDGMQIAPQRLKPPPQLKSHVWPSQVAAPLSGTGQALQLVPHELTLVLARHCPLQSWVAAGHMFMQGWLVGMHAPAHSCWPPGHAPPQLWPSQVALPPIGAEHASQDLPQWAGSLSSTHWPPHRWKPVWHARLQTCPAEQVPMPFAGVPQSADVQQPPMGTHVASGQAL